MAAPVADPTLAVVAPAGSSICGGRGGGSSIAGGRGCVTDLGFFFLDQFVHVIWGFFFIDSCYMRWNCTNRIVFLIIKVYLFLLLEGLNLSPDHYLLDLMILGFMSRMV